MSVPIVSLIAAVARNGAIGAGNAIPWRLSSDLQRFKRLTMGKPLIMGRKTYQAIGRTLAGRETIIVTRDRAWAHPGVTVAHDIPAALEVARGAPEIMVAGGGEIYAQMIGIADRLYITEVDLAPPADARFPTIDKAHWREVKHEPGVRGPRDETDFVFVDYERVQ
ncbi:MAG TPA: dihydrofolate reductase [Roseiarcus sp.]